MDYFISPGLLLRLFFLQRSFGRAGTNAVIDITYEVEFPLVRIVQGEGYTVPNMQYAVRKRLLRRTE